MAGFSVDVAALEGLARGLRDSSDRLRGVSTRLDTADAQQLGGRELDAACETFASEWKYGLGQLAKLAGGVAERVDGAVTVYRDNEDAVRTAMGGR